MQSTKVLPGFRVPATCSCFSVFFLGCSPFSYCLDASLNALAFLLQNLCWLLCLGTLWISSVWDVHSSLGSLLASLLISTQISSLQEILPKAQTKGAVLPHASRALVLTFDQSSYLNNFPHQTWSIHGNSNQTRAGTLLCLFVTVSSDLSQFLMYSKFSVNFFLEWMHES